ncbi:MAG: hypothetical protein AAFV62_08885 [Pseudomonadota bacterium]
MNPELQRNLWLECTPLRLLAAPAILGLIFALFGSSGPNWPGAVFSTAQTVFLLVTAFWGTRVAASAVAGELSGRTWDQQRLSGLGPWPMTWGKLFGSTSFIWLVLGLCVLAQMLALMAANAGQLQGPGASFLGALGWPLMAVELSGAFFAFAVAFFSSLLALNGQERSRGFDTTLFQFIALVAVFAVWGSVMAQTVTGRSFLEASDWLTDWWVALPAWQMISLSFLLFGGAALVGSYHQMRKAFAMRTTALLWLAFLAVLIAYFTGFGQGEWALVALVALSIASYAAVLLEPHKLVAYRGWLSALARGEAVALLRAPAWLYAWIGGAVIALYLVTGGEFRAPTFARDWIEIDGSVVAGALILFVLRDMGLAVWAGLRARDGRGLWTAVLLILVAGVVMPGLGFTFNASSLFTPMNTTSLVSAAVQALVVWALVGREIVRPLQPAVPEAA